MAWKGAAVPDSRGDMAIAFGVALDAERQLNARMLATLRACAVGAFTVLMALLSRHMPSWGAILPVLATYTLIAIPIAVLAARSSQVARLSALALPLLDAPAVYLGQSALMHSSPDPLVPHDA
ncbi:MAG: hypothetical protein ACYCW6_01155 [Candidatus Xenobia bacterium]